MSDRSSILKDYVSKLTEFEGEENQVLGIKYQDRSVSAKLSVFTKTVIDYSKGLNIFHLTTDFPPFELLS